MKHATTYILLDGDRIARADFDGRLRFCQSAPLPLGATMADAVRMAMGLGGKTSGATLVLSRTVWAQELQINEVQVAGLNAEQLGRALSFEAEPYSGIPVGESATGFIQLSGGAFLVAQMSALERDAIARAITAAGGQLAGIAAAGNAPKDEAAMPAWWEAQPARVAAQPVITPAAPAPSPHRFRNFGLKLEAAAILLLLACAGWNAWEKQQYEDLSNEFASVARDLEGANRQNDGLRKEMAQLEKQEQQQKEIRSRRGALLELLKAVAALRPEDLVVRSLTAEGASSIVLGGISLEAAAADEFSIVLSKQLKTAGWIAHPRSKKGRRTLANGGPWEFELLLTHEEQSRNDSRKLSQNGGRS